VVWVEALKPGIKFVLAETNRPFGFRLTLSFAPGQALHPDQRASSLRSMSARWMAGTITGGCGKVIGDPGKPR
jgi:hypothetical protein